MPWYVNSDSTLLNYAKTHALIKQHENFPMGGHILKEVKIKAKKIIKDSQNLNGPGEADIILDEKDMEAAGKKTLLQLLQENVKGFKIGVVKQDWFFIQDVKIPIELHQGMVVSGPHEWYFINDKPVKVYIDGISVTDIYPNTDAEILRYSDCFTNLVNYLNGHSAEDIKGIEVDVSDKYTSTYVTRHVPMWLQFNTNPDDVAFIEITTRSGHGPVIDNTPGMYLYKPLPFIVPKQFYSPRYTVKNKDTIKDYRSTIFWAPYVLTDKEGKATVSFYASDKRGTYTVIVEGTDGNGAIGSQRSKINVKDK